MAPPQGPDAPYGREETPPLCRQGAQVYENYQIRKFILSELENLSEFGILETRLSVRKQYFLFFFKPLSSRSLFLFYYFIIFPFLG